MSDSKTDRNEGLGEQEAVRRDKMRKLGEAGVELFPHKIPMTHSIQNIVSAHSESGGEDLEAAGIDE